MRVGWWLSLSACVMLLISAALAAPMAKLQILEATSAEKMGELKKAHVVHSGPATAVNMLDGTEGANATSTAAPSADAVSFFLV